MRRQLVRWIFLPALLVLFAAVLLWWRRADPFAEDHGAPPYASCIGDKETCNLAARYVADHWPDIAPWDDPVGPLRISDISWSECDYVDPDLTTCYYVRVQDASHNMALYLHFTDGYTRDGKALSQRIEPVAPP